MTANIADSVEIEYQIQIFNSATKRWETLSSRHKGEDGFKRCRETLLEWRKVRPGASFRMTCTVMAISILDE